jgi:hypothetical protein
MFSARCRLVVCHYTKDYQYLHRKSISPLCHAELPCPAYTHVMPPIVPVASNFCCVSPSCHCPLLERFSWSRLPIASYVTGCSNGQSSSSYRNFCNFLHETKGRAIFQNLPHPEMNFISRWLEVYVYAFGKHNQIFIYLFIDIYFILYFNATKIDIYWQFDPTLHCIRMFLTDPQWP